MELIVHKNPDITIELNKDDVAKFSSAYYPLDEETADIFISSMSRDNQLTLKKLFEESPANTASIREIFATELAHAIELVQLCH